MTRKIIALVLAMVMCLGFAGCGAEEENENVLRVAMECAYAPYNWTQNDDSNGAVPISGTSDFAYGYDVMMAKLIAESMGKELEIVKLDWDSLVPAVASGDVDLVIAGQSITARVAPTSTAKVGDDIKVCFSLDKLHIFDKDTEQIITN